MNLNRQYALCLLCVGILVAGCTSFRQPASPLEGLLVADYYGRSMTETVNSLRATGVINKDQHIKALDYLQAALDSSTAGRVAFQQGLLVEGNSLLDKTEGVLVLLASLLAPYLPPTPENQAFVEKYKE